jgi:hypothetical protein
MRDEDGLSAWEWSALVQGVRPALVYAWFLSRQHALAASGALSGAGGLETLGWELMLLVMVNLGSGLALQIGATVLMVAKGGENIHALDDERDRMFEARAMVRGYIPIGLGFLSGVIALWQGWGAVWGINMIVAGMVLSDMTVNLDRFFRYWRGG